MSSFCRESERGDGSKNSFLKSVFHCMMGGMECSVGAQLWALVGHSLTNPKRSHRQGDTGQVLIGGLNGTSTAVNFEIASALSHIEGAWCLVHLRCAVCLCCFHKERERAESHSVSQWCVTWTEVMPLLTFENAFIFHFEIRREEHVLY